MRLIHLLSHVASNEVSDSQPVGLGHYALNFPQTMLEIPIESTHIFLFFYFFNFFLSLFFFFVFLGGAHWPSFEGVPSLIKSL